jgi:tetratricopeptide (TPR) repeat protein
MEEARPIDPETPARSDQMPNGDQEDGAAAKETALVRWRQKVELNPNQAEAHFGLAQELDRLERFDEAPDHYRRATELNPGDARFLENYGDLLLYVGKFSTATDVFKRCLEIEPNAYEPSLALSSLLRDAGDRDGAERILADVMRHHPYIWYNQVRPERETILRIRGVERSSYGILERQDGHFDYLLRGGHFSIRDLIKDRNFNIIVLNASERNLDDLTDLPAFDIIVNTIGWPDLKRDSLLSAARFIDRYADLPLINDPRQVLATTRDRNFQSLNVLDGVTFPRTEKIWWDGDDDDLFIKEVAGLGLRYPLIIRRVGTQTGTSVALVRDEAKLSRYLERNGGGKSYYCIQYHDIRRPDGLYNKMRVFCIDSRYYPVANLINDDWQIHSGDRYNVMADNIWTQDRGAALFVGCIGAENFNGLQKIKKIIKLDFFGIDFTIMEDGSLFIFELNAAMRHNFDHVKRFPYTKPYLKGISKAFHAMVEARLGKRRAIRGRHTGATSKAG